MRIVVEDDMMVYLRLAVDGFEDFDQTTIVVALTAT